MQAQRPPCKNRKVSSVDRAGWWVALRGHRCVGLSASPGLASLPWSGVGGFLLPIPFTPFLSESECFINMSMYNFLNQEIRLFKKGRNEAAQAKCHLCLLPEEQGSWPLSRRWGTQALGSSSGLTDPADMGENKPYNLAPVWQCNVPRREQPAGSPWGEMGHES